MCLRYTACRLVWLGHHVETNNNHHASREVSDPWSTIQFLHKSDIQIRMYSIIRVYRTPSLHNWHQSAHKSCTWASCYTFHRRWKSSGHIEENKMQRIRWTPDSPQPKGVVDILQGRKKEHAGGRRGFFWLGWCPHFLTPHLIPGLQGRESYTHRCAAHLAISPVHIGLSSSRSD